MCSVGCGGSGMSKWRPIETAPKTGDHFLAYCIDTVDEHDEDDRLIAKGKKERSIVVAYQIEWLGGIVQYPWNGGVPTNRRYTHWMPLPAPPVDTAS